MDFAAIKRGAPEWIKQYRYVLLVLLAGIFLMALPQGEEKESDPQPMQEEQQDLQEALGELLSRIEGAGRVEVLLTEKTGEQILYQTDENSGDSDLRLDTVLVTGADREETGLIRQVIPPTYQGAIVLCQGADSANVRLSIVEAVMSVTGLTSDSITVLKMK